MTYRFLLAHNREAEYKPTQYYITQRISTQLQKIEGRQYQILIPTAVSSTIKTKQCVKQMLYDQSQEDFIEKWFDRLFIEAKQVKLDNKFDDDIPQRYEVPVIGYDCLKSATTLIFRNLNSDKYNVIDFPGSSTCPKHIIVKSTENSIHLKFLDAKNYVSDDMSFDDFINDFGNEQPADNIIDQSRQLLYAIDNRINDYFQYKIDMLSNTSLAKLSCLEKYAVDYWLSKENSYNEQDKRKKRRIHHNIAEKDYEYFKNIFMNERCHMCQAKFTDKNKPTLDRIDNDKSRTKTNVKPCYVYDLLRKDMVGGNSFVMHRENIAGETPNDIICLDFNSFYASCMSSVQHPLIPYTNHHMDYIHVIYGDTDKQYKKIHGKYPETVKIVDKKVDAPQDFQVKPLSKLNRPYFSPKLGSWEIDIVFSMYSRVIRANQIYLFCININTKYLVVFPLRDKSAGQIKNALQILVKNYHVTNIRGDGEKGFNGDTLKEFYQENKIKTFFTDSKFTNHNSVVDSVIRTIRNAFGNDSDKFADNDLMQEMVNMYNETPHSAYENKFTPQQANDNHDIEGIFIRQSQNKLYEIKQQQQKLGLLSFVPGNILMIHLDYSKTGHQFKKQRRNFNELAEFQRYSNGNVVAKLLKPYSDVNIIELPVQYCKLVASSSQWTIVPIKTPEEQMKIFTENVQQLKSPEEIAEIPKLTRRFKYATEEEARTAALLLKKKNRARDQQKIRDYKYRAVDSQLQLVRRLKRLVISDPEDLVQLHKIVDKYDER
ncbi:MAG: hypothetical protein EZS28_009540 [Streblomastix strix]|uniref:Integrase catalytic domain-containing protein n=1 Tax=Streblomastix strix TaxID=222440 RepID=A0A5J4WIK0_9EUKA|nr:MAG: hypothetical protein EZS28_009540 [Streblomastix strix]